MIILPLAVCSFCQIHSFKRLANVVSSSHKWTNVEWISCGICCCWAPCSVCTFHSFAGISFSLLLVVFFCGEKMYCAMAFMRVTKTERQKLKSSFLYSVLLHFQPFRVCLGLHNTHTCLFSFRNFMFLGNNVRQRQWIRYLWVRPATPLCFEAYIKAACALSFYLYTYP